MKLSLPRISRSCATVATSREGHRPLTSAAGAVALLATLCLPVSANADTITETLTIPPLATTTFSSGAIDLFTNSFNQFNRGH
jgi:hypothetical protein